MVAEWVRMSPAELDRAVADPEWAEEPWSAEDVALLQEFYDGLVAHFALAARRGEGMITYLS